VGSSCQWGYDHDASSWLDSYWLNQKKHVAYWKTCHILGSQNFVIDPRWINLYFSCMSTDFFLGWPKISFEIFRLWTELRVFQVLDAAQLTQFTMVFPPWRWGLEFAIRGLGPGSWGVGWPSELLGMKWCCFSLGCGCPLHI
jgi:hypothetical protein